jgi:hypothetical protein
MKALELSEALVPTDLRDLWEAYKKKAEDEGKKVKSGGGFGGSGFKVRKSIPNLLTDYNIIFFFNSSMRTNLHILRRKRNSRRPSSASRIAMTKIWSRILRLRFTSCSIRSGP